MIEEKVSRGLANKTTILVLICFFLFGLTGLVCEILWTRMIVKSINEVILS